MYYYNINDMKEEIDIIDAAISSFAERIAKTIDDCIIEAMAAGIDLHEMAIQEWMINESGKIKYHCKAVKLKD